MIFWEFSFSGIKILSCKSLKWVLLTCLLFYREPIYDGVLDLFGISKLSLFSFIFIALFFFLLEQAEIDLWSSLDF
jgi:hypothetical protein